LVLEPIRRFLAVAAANGVRVAADHQHTGEQEGKHRYEPDFWLSPLRGVAGFPIVLMAPDLEHQVLIRISRLCEKTI
jgi:hypothetical protein